MRTTSRKRLKDLNTLSTQEKKLYVCILELHKSLLEVLFPTPFTFSSTVKGEL